MLTIVFKLFKLCVIKMEQNFNLVIVKMAHLTNIVLIAYCSLISKSLCNLTSSLRKFPPHFKFGAATSAFQVEGAWNIDGKGESYLDSITHTFPELIIDHSNADIACDSYHKFETDVTMLKELNVDFYRFSISWPRILPTGEINEINEKGVQYYKKLLASLRKAGIEPVVTMYHWDLPKRFQYLGGWSNEEIIEYFVRYANLLFDLFGDVVTYWITFNEPQSFCVVVESVVYKSDYSNYPFDVSSYLCGHHVLLAHSQIYHLYNSRYRSRQKGKISMALSVVWSEPATNNSLDIEAAERKLAFDFGWFASPLVFGNYPKIMIDQVAMKSKQQGYPKSRLPVFSKSEQALIKGTYDFLGINHYTTNLVKYKQNSFNETPSFTNDTNVISYIDPSWPTSSSDWLSTVPWGFRKLLKWIKDTYRNPEIIITENGFSDKGELNDTGRISYYKGYLTEAVNSIYVDNVRLTGFIAWSLMDNFEWFNGYTARFGFYYVNFTDPNRRRMIKESGKFYKNLINTKCLVDTCT